MPSLRTLALTVVAALFIGQQTSAQNQTLTLSYSFLERYIESLRQQTAIPGMSAALVQGGTVVWARGFGRQDIEANVAATAATPYAIGGLSQIFGSTMLLKKCVDERYLRISDRVQQWWPGYSDSAATIGHLLAHVAPDGTYRFDLARFAALTPVIERCHDTPYRKALAEEIFERLGMAESVPGLGVTQPTDDDRDIFSTATLHRYATLAHRIAVPYQVNARLQVRRTEYSGRTIDASTGVITTVSDLARFDAALSRGVLLTAPTVQTAWSRAVVAGAAVPTGLGWFVQGYNGEPIVWQFGIIKDAYSSLIIKAPNRDLTLILLANSDGLSAPFALENGDVSASLFARVFLKLLVN